MRATTSKSTLTGSDEPELDTAQSAASQASRRRKSDKRFGLKPEYIWIAKQMCERGGTVADLAKAFRVGLDTIALWQSTNAEFAEACRLGMDAAESRVERALFERAVGYTHKADTVVRHRAGISIVQRKVHVPADPRACKLWLERRQADLSLTRESPIQQLARQLMGTALRPKQQS